jgi:surface antigen
MGKIFPLFAAAFVAVSAPAVAADADIDMRSAAPSTRELPPYLQCVPYAREVSGIEIFGDAHTWWDQAEGRYKRGHKPKVGAVMAFRPYGDMTLGHVAAVSKVVDKRTVLLRHANWSPIDGRRGQIENDVRAIDVSPDNDWSQVRVWYAPLQDLGTTAWPVEGFIYGDRAQGGKFRIAAETPRPAPAPVKAKARVDVVGDIIGANS